MRLVIQTLAVGLAWSSFVSAGIVGGFVQVTSEGGDSPPPNFVTQDLAVTATTDWLAGNLIINLTVGSINQSIFIVGIGPPSAALIGAIPATRWDTYLTGSKGIAGGAPSSAGGAVDILGTQDGAFNESHIDINWFTTATDDIGSFTLGRFTFSNDAEGDFTLRLDAAPGQSSAFLRSDALNSDGPFILTGQIHRGLMTAVPEAGTLATSAIAAACLAMTIHRRSVRRTRNVA